MRRELFTRTEAVSGEPREAKCVRRVETQELASDDRRSWMKFAGLVETGSPRSSQTIDEIVNGPADCERRR